MYMCEYENFVILRNSYTFQWDRNELYKISRKLLLNRKNSIRLRSFLVSRATDTWRSRIFSIRQFIEIIHEGEQWYPVKFNERPAHYIRILARLTPSPPSSPSFLLFFLCFFFTFSLRFTLAERHSCLPLSILHLTCPNPLLRSPFRWGYEKVSTLIYFCTLHLFLTIRMNANVDFNFSSETGISIEESYKYIIFLGIIEKVTCFCP